MSEVIINDLDEEVKRYVEQDDERLSTKTEEKIRGLEHTNEIHLFRLQQLEENEDHLRKEISEY